MILIEKTEVVGFEPAIRGMRNPKNSWEKSDSRWENDLTPYPGLLELPSETNPVIFTDDGNYVVGPNDHTLMMSLALGGPVHGKFCRMLVVYADITAPLYWWKEYDTYKVGTVANSCSTMHKIHAKPFEISDFSFEHIESDEKFISQSTQDLCMPYRLIEKIVKCLNMAREAFLETEDKKYWWTMIQMLPSSYNQKRTVMLNYEVLAGIYKHRKNHKLDEWHDFCKWIEGLPESDVILRYEKEHFYLKKEVINP